ncbi:hypothetical protein [Streptomyces sp. NPDC056982]
MSLTERRCRDPVPVQGLRVSRMRFGVPDSDPDREGAEHGDDR